MDSNSIIAADLLEGPSDILHSLNNRTCAAEEQLQGEPLLISLNDLVLRFFMPICCIVGLSGNCMVWMLIRSNRILKKLPSNLYLLALAALSSLFLVTVLLFWVELVTDSALYSKYAIMCKLVIFTAHFCDFASVWLIVLVCFERLVLLYRARRATSVSKAITHIVVVLVVSAAFNSWILLVASSREADECTPASCDRLDKYATVYTVMNAMESVLCMGIPGPIILISNVLVIAKLRAHLKQIPSSPTVSFRTGDFDNTHTHDRLHNFKTSIITKSKFGTHLTPTPQPTTISQSAVAVPYGDRAVEAANGHLLPQSTNGDQHEATTNGHVRNSLGGLGKRHKKKGRMGKLRSADLQLTRSLLVVTTVFILFNMPNYIWRISDDLFSLLPEHTTAAYKIASSVVHALLYGHHAILFYLYIFYSPTMKKRLAPTATKLLECYCLKPVPEFGHTEYHTSDQTSSTELTDLSCSPTDQPDSNIEMQSTNH